jgi:hypothetical protein
MVSRNNNREIQLLPTQNIPQNMCFGFIVNFMLENMFHKTVIFGLLIPTHLTFSTGQICMPKPSGSILGRGLFFVSNAREINI